MVENLNKDNPRFNDYLWILIKWKKFIFINMVIITAFVAGLSFLIPDNFRATTTLMIPPDNSMSLSGLGGLVSGRSPASLGTKLLGISSSSEDILLGILNSREAVTNAVKKFHLQEYYEIDDNIDKVIKAFRSDLSFEVNEFGLIEINVVNKNPLLGADIANYFAEVLDSMNILLNTQAAKNNRTFIEQRYFQNIQDLRAAEDSMFKFQKKYGVFAVPEQLEASIKASAEIEAMLLEKQLTSEIIKIQYGDDSPQFRVLNEQISYIKNKIEELKRSGSLTTESNVLFPFSKVPEMTIEYFRLYREIELQATLMEFILPMYEQAKVEEKKSIPTVMVVDKAVPSQLKYSPRRSLIVLGFGFLFLFIHILIVYRAEGSVKREQYSNPFELKEKNFFLKLSRFYKIKS